MLAGSKNNIGKSAHISLVTSSCVVVSAGDMVVVEEGVEIGDWLGGRDEAGIANVVCRGDEAILSTLAG